MLAAVLATVVPAATVLALFVHAHPDDHDTDHHAAHAIHSHLGGHTHPGHHADPHAPAAGGTVITDDDDHDSAVYVGAFVAEAMPSFSLVAVVALAADLPTPAERAAQPPLLVVHGHDPPALRLRPSRAPPRLPVLI